MKTRESRLNSVASNIVENILTHSMYTGIKISSQEELFTSRKRYIASIEGGIYDQVVAFTAQLIHRNKITNQNQHLNPHMWHFAIAMYFLHTQGSGVGVGVAAMISFQVFEFIFVLSFNTT